MVKYFNAFLKAITTAIELVISLILAASIIVMIGRLLLDFHNIPYLDVYPNYDDLLTNCFNLIIGVELIRMLYKHNPSTVFEVLLFAIARQVILAHDDAITTLIGVIAIAILFATRKFLFVAFDKSEKIIFRANQSVHHVNQLLHVHIPYKDDETLGEVMIRKLEAEQQEIGVGACVYDREFGLRIAKMNHGKITRIELIRSIQ